jgi:sRNA-binding regulator protein Hfq
VENIKRGTAKGHEIPLASMIRSKNLIRVHMMSGIRFIGNVSQFDKFTITLVNWSNELEGDLDVPTPRTFFKHAIDSFESA